MHKTHRAFRLFRTHFRTIRYNRTWHNNRTVRIVFFKSDWRTSCLRLNVCDCNNPECVNSKTESFVTFLVAQCCRHSRVRWRCVDSTFDHTFLACTRTKSTVPSDYRIGANRVHEINSVLSTWTLKTGRPTSYYRHDLWWVFRPFWTNTTKPSTAVFRPLQSTLIVGLDVLFGRLFVGNHYTCPRHVNLCVRSYSIQI